MVKIKNKVTLKPKELIKYLLDLEETEFTLYIETEDGYNNLLKPKLKVENYITYNEEDETFTVEVEEELTENTVLPSVVVVRTQYFPNNGHSVNVAKINSKSIKQVIENQPNNSKFEYNSIYLMESERIGQLIWKDGELVGDE